MKFVYPAIIYNEEGEFWGEFPDLEGAVSQGDDIINIIDNLEEALEGYISSVFSRGIKLKEPSDLTELRDRSTEGEIIYIKTDIDLNKENKSVKKTLTIPFWLNEKAKKESINFSKVLQEALVEKLHL